jgi:glycerol-3-phosphate dehydrogenase
VIGTTDTPLDKVTLEPHHSSAEIDFLLETAGRYLARQPTRDDILSTFSGIRPLVNTSGSRVTSRISREHAIEASPSGLVTIAGGKWTTYREMAEEGVNHAAEIAGLPRKDCVTYDLRIHGCPEHRPDPVNDLSDVYGSDRQRVQGLIDAQPQWGAPLGEKFGLTRAEVVWAVRAEMARTVEDVLSRRSRVLLLDAREAKTLAEPVAGIVAEELNRSEDWRRAQVSEFQQLADQYLDLK